MPAKPAAVQTINTSTIAKLYRTTTTDIEKRLRSMGHRPLEVVKQPSGRRFMVWDKVAVLTALDDWKAKRLEELQEREALRLELTEKQKMVPRTSYDSPDVLTGALPPTVPLPELLARMEALRAEVAHLEAQVQQVQDQQKNPQEP